MSKLAFSIAKSRTKFLLLLLALEIVVLSCISPYFLSLSNLLQITQFGAGLTLLSLGEALVMVGGKDGIDISIGSTMSLSGVIFGLAVMGGASIPVAIVISLAAGAALGAVNGVLIAMAGVPALIATLGTQYVYSSLALYLTGGIPISGFPESFEWLSLKSTFGIPNQILFVVIPVTILVFILIYKMKFGRRAYLMGTNPEAAKFTGIREVRIRMGIYILAGVLAAISAVINNSWLMTARADAGTGMEMQAITVAVLGGISVAGGSGHLGGVLIGVIGAALGAVNGVLIAMAGVPALIATLGTQYVYSSLALYLTGGIPISGFPESFEWLSLKSTFGIPNQILFVVIPVTILVFILIYKMKFGRRAYLMGTNPEAAKFTGIREVRIRMGIYILAGVLAAISAVINNSWLMTARADAGTGMEMQAITVAVLGGISVAGGSGHLGGVLIGVIIITMMNSGLQIANINSVWQLAVLGLILILAIILNHMMNKFVIRVEKNRE